MAKQTDKPETQVTPRTLEVTRKGNIETTVRPNGTVIVNAVATEAKKPKED